MPLQEWNYVLTAAEKLFIAQSLSTSLFKDWPWIIWNISHWETGKSRKSSRHIFFWAFQVCEIFKRLRFTGFTFLNMEAWNLQVNDPRRVVVFKIRKDEKFTRLWSMTSCDLEATISKTKNQQQLRVSCEFQLCTDWKWLWQIQWPLSQ